MLFVSAANADAAHTSSMLSELKSAKVVVHFGMPKTGTSSIQESLYRNLSDRRFHYINLGRSNASNGIANAFKADTAQFHVHVKRGTDADELRQLRDYAVSVLSAELRAAEGKTAILSAEYISSLRKSELRDLCGALSRNAQVISAVGYVRRPKDYLESAFQQKVKGGMQQFDASGMSMRYRTRFEKFDAVLGRNNVHFWLFDPASFTGQCVVQDFCSRLGVRFQAADVIRANEGLSLPALSLLFAYRRFGPGYGKGPTVIRENKLLIEHVRSLPGPKLRLHSSVVAPIIEKHRWDVEWMEARLGTSLREDLAAHDDSAVRSEEDLLKFSPEALRWLAEELGEEYAERWRPEMNPTEVAEWMHYLRIKLAAADHKVQKAASVVAGAKRVPATPPGPAHGAGKEEVPIKELVRGARQSLPQLEKMTDNDAHSLLREVFAHIRRKIDTGSETVVTVNGLGLFRIRQTLARGERKMPSRRIAFRVARSNAA